MSSMQYVSAKAHVVTKAEAGKGLAKKAAEVFSFEGDGIDWCETTTEAGDGYVGIAVKYSGVNAGPISAIEEALEEVATLGDGSYGLMVVESDWGVERFDCYGGVDLVEAESVGEETVWSSESPLDLSVTMGSDEWGELLGCDADSLQDEIESQGDELLPRLVPTSFVQACEDDGGAYFTYFDTESSGDGENAGDSDEVTVIFELDGSEVRHATFMRLADALMSDSTELPVPGVKVELGLEGASGEESRMVDADAFAMLVFRLLSDGDKYIKVLVPKSLS
ncbi:hypothetical protein [Olsenella intestinalis]|uniref:hypothetical protein n=1 Tax=Olsenella intestinalis TaxID=2930083 RepID=UPI00200BBB33|nr:hypothetical protein [Olsenella intestinalis]